MMHKHARVTLERLELLNDGKCYLASDSISILSHVYSKRSSVASIEVWRNTKRFTKFSDVLAFDAFEPVDIGDSFGPTWATQWFRVKFSIPDDWEASEIHFLWDSSSEATLWSSDGQILQGFNGSGGDDRRAEFILSRPDTSTQHPDLPNEFYIEMACNEMFGAGKDGMIQPPDNEKTFSLKQCEIAIFQREIWNLYCDFRILFDAAKTLPKESKRAQDALYFANQICNFFSPTDPKSWSHCRKLASTFLQQKNGSSVHKVTPIGHCHIDTAWLWPYAETHRKCARSWATALEYMKYYENFTFCASSAQQYDWVRQDYPELFSRIQCKVSEKRFEVVGGTWVEFDGNIPSGESIVRQFLYGQRFFQKNFNETCREFFMPDTFGYCAQLPQIMKKAGIQYFVTQKLSWNLINKFPHTTFNWKGIDGTSVLTHFPPADTYNSNARLDQMYMSLSNNKDVDRTTISLMLFGHGDGGGGPKHEMFEMLQRMKDLQGVPSVVNQPIHSFFQELEQTSRDLCTWTGELYLELHRGTYTTQASVKRFNRKCELLLRDCEFICSLGLLISSAFEYPHDELEKLWKLVLLNQFHDVLPGTSIGMVYKDSMIHYNNVMSTGSTLIAKAVKSFSDSSAAVSPCPSFINSLSWDRIEIIEVSNRPEGILYQELKKGKFLISVSAVSAGIGGTYLSLNDSEFCTIKEDIESHVIENKFFRARIDECGRVSSFWLKSADRELITCGPANQFTIFEDVPFFWDAWDIMIYHMETRREVKAKNKIQISVLETGPLCVSLSITFKFSEGSSIIQVISASAVSPALKFTTKVNWQEKRKLLKVEFPTSIVSPLATYEIQYGHLQRPTHYNTSWDLAKFEVCGHRWADLSEYDFGLSILNDCKYSYSIHDGKISLTLLKAPKAPDSSSDIGEHLFTYEMFVHDGSFQQARVIQRAYELNAPLQVFEPSSIHEEKSFFSLSTENVILDCVKRAEDDPSSLILRLYEAYGGGCSTKLFFGFPVIKIVSCDLLEVEQTEIPLSNENSSEGEANFIQISFSAFEIKSLKISF